MAASTVWEILRETEIDPAPERNSSTWGDFLRSQADALLACDFFETVTLTGMRLYVFVAIEHANRQVCIPGDHANRIAALDDQFRTESERVGRAAYAAEHAIIAHLDNVAPRRPGKTMTEEIAHATAALEGADDDVKTKAHKRLLLLTRA